MMTTSLGGDAIDRAVNGAWVVVAAMILSGAFYLGMAELSNALRASARESCFKSTGHDAYLFEHLRAVSNHSE